MHRANRNATRQPWIVLLCFILLVSFGLMPGQNVIAKELYTTDGVHIRKKPDATSKIRGSVPAGTAVTKTGSSGNWILVYVDGIEGYIYKSYLSENETAASDAEPKKIVSPTTFINTDGVNLRKKASGSCKIKAVLSAGTAVTVLSQDGNWTQVSTQNGNKGYVYSIYLGENSANTQNTGTQTVPTKSDIIAGYRTDAIDYAKGRLGDLYSQELRDSEGYADCSSLVRDSYQSAAGKSIGDTTVTQTDQMESYLYPISSIFDVTPGDLVYHLDGDSHNNHTGIYLGDGQVLHASKTSGDVKISAFSGESTYWIYGCNAAAYCLEQ